MTDRNPAQEGIDAARADARRALAQDAAWARRSRARIARARSALKASITYNDRMAQIEGQIRNLQGALKRHKVAQAADPRNWGFPGDLGRIHEGLKDILEGLS